MARLSVLMPRNKLINELWGKSGAYLSMKRCGGVIAIAVSFAAISTILKFLPLF